MNKVLSILLSLSLIYSSITPSLAQPVGRAFRGISSATRLSPKTLEGLRLITSRALAFPVRLPVRYLPSGVIPSATLRGSLQTKVAQGARINPNELKDLSTVQLSPKQVLETLHNFRQAPLQHRDLLFLNAFPHLHITQGHDITAADRLYALNYFRKAATVAVAHPATSANIWGRNMSIISNMGIYGSATDAILILEITKAAPAKFTAYTDVITARALISLGAFKELQQLAALRTVNGTLPAHWKGIADYASTHELPAELPAVAEGQVPALTEEAKTALQEWNPLNLHHENVSAQATEEWLSLREGANANVISDDAGKTILQTPVRPTIQNDLKLTAQEVDGLALDATELPAGQQVAAKTADVSAADAQPAAAGGAPAVRHDFTLSANTFLNTQTLLTSLEKATNKKSGLFSGFQKNSPKAVVKRAQQALESVKANTDKAFISAAQKAYEGDKYLTTADYNKMLSENFSNEVAANPLLAPYAEQIETALRTPGAAQAPAAAKREIPFSFKIRDMDGKVLPVTLEVNVRLMDDTAVKQFEKLAVADSEVFTLTRGMKDGTASGPFELMLTTPGGSQRPIYEPFIVGGKDAMDALARRLLGDYKAGLPKPRVDIEFYSDKFAERATMFAGLTEGLGGLPQSTVAPQSTALGISDPKALQEGVSHSQMGNVASVVFGGLQKALGIKNTLALGLGISAAGLLTCGIALNAPELAAKVAGLASGSLLLGIGANGGVKSTNSIFAKELSNDNTSGTARMGFVNARASIGTMTGYLFFPASVLFALSGLEAFQVLYYGATAVPAYALYNLLRSKVRNVGLNQGQATGFVEKAKAVGNVIKGVGVNIVNNIKFAFTGGYKERLAVLRQKRAIKAQNQHYKQLVEGQATPIATETAPKGVMAKAADLFTTKLPAATSQYLWKMMAAVGLYHFAGMMYNSGPGAIIGNFIKSPEGAAIVDMAQHMPLPVTSALAGGLAYGATKLGQAIYHKLVKKPAEMSLAEKPLTFSDKVTHFFKKNALPLTVGAGTAAANAFVPQVSSVFTNLFSRLDPTAVAQIATFFTAYIGVWAGRQYLSKFVKSGKLSPQGIIGASGLLSTTAVGLAFIPGMPLAAQAALWGVAGLGFANLAGFENSLAMEKYPNQKPAVNMAYTLARLSGAATVLYGSLANYFSSVGIPHPETNALVLPAGALALATFMNRKYLTHNFVQDVKRWRGLPPKLSYSALRTAADDFYQKFTTTNAAATWDQDVKRVADNLFKDTRHELTTVEELLAPVNYKLQLNTMRLRVIDKLKELLHGASENSVALSTPQLTYKAFRTLEIQPLMRNMTGKVISPEREEELVRITAEGIFTRYHIKASDLDDMASGIQSRNVGLDQFRLEVLREMYKMELTKIAQDRVARYQGNRPGYDRAMTELKTMADKVLGSKHTWQAPEFQP